MIAQSFDFQVLPLGQDMLLRPLKSLHSSSLRFAQANGMSPESPRMIAFPAMRRSCLAVGRRASCGRSHKSRLLAACSLAAQIYQKGVSGNDPSLMLSILLAEPRPLFFRYGLRRDKDESVELEFNFLIPDPDFAFLWQHAIHRSDSQLYSMPPSVDIRMNPDSRVRRCCS
jgi:hypothetical protein